MRLKQFLDKLVLTNLDLTFNRLKPLTTAEFCDYVLHAEENNALEHTRAPSSRALSNTSYFDNNELPQETLLTLLNNIMEEDVYFLASVVDLFEETIEESPYLEHEDAAFSSTKEVTLEQATSSEDVDDLETLISWPEDLLAQDSTDVSFEESPTVNQDSVPSVEAEGRSTP
ncbi:hypothetical protein ACNVED_03970 [Legionella sp. D16C41]|uniref:hypothetical protein n=1 Tax=Legionella sp. D16C41 TaxID=3402688 RepID=UPI003AF87BF9